MPTAPAGIAAGTTRDLRPMLSGSPCSSSTRNTRSLSQPIRRTDSTGSPERPLFRQRGLIHVHDNLVMIRRAGRTIPISGQVRHGHRDQRIGALLRPALLCEVRCRRLCLIHRAFDSLIERLVDELTGLNRQFDADRDGATAQGPGADSTCALPARATHRWWNRPYRSASPGSAPPLLDAVVRNANAQQHILVVRPATRVSARTLE
ncbi:MAG: hypothetical protein U5K38_12885 [Woeseiaceae bacterium]|nr:hypothetical protein [Woeseiaceae bacterium]